MKVLVIGGTGFLGKHLVRRLVLDDAMTVRTYGRRQPPIPSTAEYLYGDLTDRQRLRTALSGIDCVFHFAWTSVPQTSNEDPQADVQANLVASIGLLDACRDAGVRMVVFPSSGGTVYGNAPDPHAPDENSLTDPISSYGISKLSVEKYLALYWHMHGLDYRILRISNAYGEGQQAERPQGLIGIALRKAAAGGVLTVLGSGSMTRDYVYAGDVVDCCVAAAQTPLGGSAPRVFNVGSGKAVSINDVLGVISAVTGQALKVEYRPARSCDVEHATLNTDRVRETLGWSPKTSLNEGIARTWKWVQSSQHDDPWTR